MLYSRNNSEEGKPLRNSSLNCSNIDLIIKIYYLLVVTTLVMKLISFHYKSTRILNEL